MKFENIKIGQLYRITNKNKDLVYLYEPTIIPINYAKKLIYFENNSEYKIYDSWDTLKSVNDKIVFIIEYKKIYIQFSIPHSEDFFGFEKYFKVLINKNLYYIKPEILKKLYYGNN